MRYSITILLCILLASCKTTSQNSTENTLESKIDSILSNGDFNGVVLLTNDTNTIYSKAMGFSDLENKVSIMPNDQFVIGSISKQITAVLVLREYENGKIRLDDKINEYLTEIKQPWSKEVTIHHLLTHTHGIADVDQPLEFEQGSQFQYSQLGYELLAEILERITNQSFEKLATALFGNYGLNNTFHPDNKIYKNLVKGYEEQENGNMVFVPNSLQSYVAAGSFISNAPDLNKWNQLLHSDKLIKKQTLIGLNMGMA